MTLPRHSEKQPLFRRVFPGSFALLDREPWAFGQPLAGVAVPAVNPTHLGAMWD